ncbi:MAG TPA: Rrf2 family transcriptional regulator [Bacteroidales bacterium]|jgi:Rrf2 family protein|nr:Rrf2 family transcriptional regulator [Bacteroidales bacterium]
MLTKSTEYAIRALVYVQLQNWDKKRPGVNEIAKEIETPPAFTAKILQLLTKHKLIESSKGRGGGFYFGNENQDLTLYKVIVIMEGDSCFTKCGFGLKNCSNNNPCPLHEKYVHVREGFLEIAETETIQTISKRIVDGKAFLKSENLL